MIHNAFTLSIGWSAQHSNPCAPHDDECGQNMIGVGFIGMICTMHIVENAPEASKPDLDGVYNIFDLSAQSYARLSSPVTPGPRAAPCIRKTQTDRPVRLVEL